MAETIPLNEPGSRTGGRFEVHIADNELERAAICSFRYRVIVDEMGVYASNADHALGKIRDPLDERAVHLYLTHNGQLQACLRLVFGADGPLPRTLKDIYALDRFEEIDRGRMCFSDGLLVAAPWRASRVPAVLAGAAYKIARRRGALLDFCHAAPGLVGLYQKLGYRSYTSNFNDPDFGLQVPMLLIMDDERHLLEVNSPFAPLARAFPASAALANWFAINFPEAAAQVAKRLRDEGQFWEYLTRRLHQTPLIGIPLFHDLTYREAASFLKDAQVLECRTGETLVSAGSVGNEMFVVLSGAVEVRVGDRRKPKTLAAFQRGAVLGEMAFLSETPRTADVIVTEEAEVLVLTQAFFRHSMQTMPAIAAKVLLNLSMILCDRLSDSNRLVVMAAAGRCAPAELPDAPARGGINPPADPIAQPAAAPAGYAARGAARR